MFTTPLNLPGVVTPFGSTLPAYIQPIPSSIAVEDLEYLHKMEAFTVPDTNLRNQLLHSYVQHVHPYHPVIDLEDFLLAVERNNLNNTVSLFLFQAVMFAGAVHVDIEDSASYGYATKKGLKRTLFKRLRLLYDFDYETDQITILQGVLLMTYWYENMNEPKDVTYWLDIAISMTRMIDLTPQRSGFHSDSKSLRSRRLCKRIWWSCFIRDRLIALDLSRSARMSLAAGDVPMLEVSDFETRKLPAELTQLLGGCSTVESCEKRMALAQMCIALAQLCVDIEPILNKQLDHQQELGVLQTNVIHRLSKTISISVHEAFRYDQQLSKWCQNLDLQNLHDFSPSTYGRKSAIDCKAIHLHRALLASTYHAVMIVLYRPLCWDSEVAAAPEIRALAERKVREAANRITTIYRDLLAHELLSHLPYTGVTCLLYAVDVHLHDMDSADSAINVAGIYKLRTCIRTLERLRQRYSLTGLNSWLINTPTRHSRLKCDTSNTAEIDRMSTVSSRDYSIEPDKTPAKRARTASPEEMKTDQYRTHGPMWSSETPDNLSAVTTPSLEGSDGTSCSTGTERGTINWVNVGSQDAHEDQRAIDPRKLTPIDEFCADLPDGSIFCAAGEDSLHAGLQWLQEFDFNMSDEANADFELSTQQSPG
ncbi:fungal-specific transcription factor domain-containing protein [Exophiala viscosa]|uniref:fungal-specific transcription factor domain-containing protein n=1 Tax=Exophiala viscosa TaxID=2486360 RepID=UPI00218EFD68|nr:fungal-specific transcription factor domain-containing protein [Exophiala viscosa]